MSPEVETGLQIGGYAGLFGLFAWLVRHVFQHTIPRLATAFEKSLERNDQTFQKSLDKCLQTFREEMAEQRRAARDLANQDRQALEAMARAVEKTGTEFQLLREVLRQNGVGPRE